MGPSPGASNLHHLKKTFHGTGGHFLRALRFCYLNANVV
jgi:hypothetical protein